MKLIKKEGNDYVVKIKANQIFYLSDGLKCLLKYHKEQYSDAVQELYEDTRNIIKGTNEAAETKLAEWRKTKA